MNHMKPVRIKQSDGDADDIAVPSAASDVYSHSVKINKATSFCVSMRAKSSTGTPDIDVYLQQTHVTPIGFDPSGPAEGAAGDATNGWVRPEGSSKLIDITDENWHHFTISPVTLPYLRMEFDPQGANPADCTVECWITRLEELN